MIIEEIGAKKKQFLDKDNQSSEAQTTSVFSNLNANNPEFSRSALSFDVSKLLFATSYTLEPGISIQLQVPTELLGTRNDGDSQRLPYIPETPASTNISSATFSRLFHYQKTGALPFSQFNRARRGNLINIPSNRYFNQLQNLSTATNKSHRSKISSSILITNVIAIPALSRTPLVCLVIVDTFLMSSTNDIPSETGTNL